MASKTKDGTWRARKRVKIDGRYKRLSENFRTKAAAERWEATITLAKESPQPLAEAVPAKVTFKAFADRWLEEHCEVEKVESQWSNDRSVLKTHLLPEFGEMLLADITDEHVRRFRMSLKTKAMKRGPRAIKPKTANNILGILIHIMGRAVDWKVITVSPAAKLKKLPVAEQAFDYWTPAERDHFIRFASKINPAFADIVTVACHTGLRRGEIAGLKRSQLDFERRQILVDAAYCYRTHKRVRQTKNKAVGFVPMNNAVYQVLQDRRLAGPNTDVFQVGNELRDAWRTMEQLCAAVGVKVIRFHDLRHTFASCLVMAGVPLYTVQKLMRHKTIAMTQRYSHLAPKHLHEAVAALERPAAPQTSGPDLGPMTQGVGVGT